jgi:hypothetical protein
MEEQYFMTAAGYLSINKNYLNSTSNRCILVNGVDYSLDVLRKNITYTDNRNFFRWSRKDFIKAII